MRSRSGLAGGVLAVLALAVVTVAPAAPAAVRARLSPPLAALGGGLPAARSGQTYLWTLKVEGGTPPYHCIPVSLGVGSIHLTSTCHLTGTAPVVSSESITGPFRFKVQDSSAPPKTSEFPTMNFTTVAKKLTADTFNGSYTGTGTSSVTTDCPATAGSKAVHIVKSIPVTHAAVAGGTFFGKPIVVSAKGGSVRFSNVVGFVSMTWSATFTLGAGGVPTMTNSEIGSGKSNGCTTIIHAQFTGKRTSP